MAVLIVVEKPELWPWEVPQATMVSAREYLTDPEFVEMKRAKVFNLCRSYGYQSIGYYVSLLAEARGHKPMPSVTTVQDLKQSSLIRIVSEDLEDLVQKGLAPIRSNSFELSIYFGRNLAKRFAHAGYRSLLIDGDTRLGELHREYSISRRPGLLDHLHLF